ncbi:MAG: hypothetical protein ACLPV8_26495 [Steroidobacteraceae bacterium]
MNQLGQPLNPGQQLYVDLMDEARIRIHAIRDVVQAKDSWVPRLLQEFVYLQLRILCEIIAVGCLVAHGDITQRDTLKSWKLTEIMRALENLNADFFPKGIRIRVDSVGVHLDDYNVPQLSKTELIRLWEQSGNVLHRGSAKRLLSETGKPIVVNLDPIIEDSLKIKNLLEEHIISSADRKKHLIAALSHHQAGGNAIVWVANAP